MCRSIRKLGSSDGPASREEIEAAALQYVRKVSGIRKPSRLDSETFETAVSEIAAATRRMLRAMEENRDRRKAG